jgi:O-succinylbenzoic acid--CoA ligase
MILNDNHWIIEQADKNPKRIALISQSKEINYGELLNSSKRLANYLSEQGISKNDHVGIYFSHSPEFVILVNAIWLIGAVAIPLNINLSNKEISELVSIANIKFLITNAYQLKIDQSSKIELLNYDQFTFNDNTLTLVDNFDLNKVCLMMFTSGSTGTPKCVRLMFKNLLASYKSMNSVVNQSANDIWLASLPFFHIGGFSIIVRALISGSKIAFPNSTSSVDVIKAIGKYKPSFFSMVPTTIKKLIVSGVKPWDDLKIIYLGGGPIQDEVINLIIKNNWPVNIVYGATETSSMVTMCTVDNLVRNGYSAGVALPGVNLFISDSNNTGKVGRIVIQSESVSSSYYNSTETENNLVDGKYFSNDIGWIDSNGNLHIVGRKDDIIISGGENISLVEIERELNSSNNFGNCTTLGIKDKKWGQSYLVVSDSKKRGICQLIIKYLEQNVARFKLPKEIIQVEEIPLTELGKVDKNKLKKTLNFDFL